MNIQEFIEEIGQAARENMQRTGILASLIIAQACLESGYGKSGLAQKGKNLFGIKGCGTAGSVTMPTNEWENGQKITINAAFRAYETWAESIADHSALFLRYSRYKNLVGETDYRRACHCVQQDGYATDPDYAKKLIALIEQHNLTRFDQPEPKKEEEYMIKPEDAKQICYWLGTLWKKADTQASKNEFHRLANEVRKAAGQKPQ